MRATSYPLACIAAVLLASSHSLAQSGAPYEGVTLFHPTSSTDTYLLELDGTISHVWPGTYMPGQAVYLKDNGNLIRTLRTSSYVGGTGGGIEEVLMDGTVVWQFFRDTAPYLTHHDVEIMPNGNILMLSWDFRTRAQAIAQGRDPALTSGPNFVPDSVVEIRPDPSGGTVVWEWHTWDHLVQDFDATKANYGVVADNPGLIDINFPAKIPNQGDWNHLNSVDYNADLDQILVSTPEQKEIWIIDHSTTTAEAAGHTGGKQGRGGDLLYRWGNPQAYDHGFPATQTLYGQHDAQWIDAGNPGEDDILIFNNGTVRPGGAYSSIDQITPPVTSTGSYTYTPGTPYGPTSLTWTYVDPVPANFYSSNISGCQRLPNGNTLVCSGAQGWFFEVDAAGALLWEYTNTLPSPAKNAVFKIRRYSTCTAPVNYCTTSTNSAGSGALIGYTGTTSLSANDLVLTVTDTPPTVFGIFYFGSDTANVPLGDGIRCVGGSSIYRLPVVATDAAGQGSYSLDFTDAGSTISNVLTGETWNFQFWYRDKPFGGAGYNFSDGLTVTFCD